MVVDVRTELGAWATEKSPWSRWGPIHMNPSFRFLYRSGFQCGPNFPPKEEEPLLAMGDMMPSDSETGA